MSGASERANGRASGPVLQSVFLAVFDHSDCVKSPENGKKGNFCHKTSFFDHLQFPQMFETIFFGFLTFFYVDYGSFKIVNL